MKAISIVPKAHFNLVAGAPMFMALAQYHNDPEYVAFFKEQAAEGGYVILDNGVAEGTPMTIEQVVAMSLEIGASEIILPDAYLDTEKTLEQTFNAIEYLKAQGLRDKFKLMAVPQGATREDWLWCCDQILRMDVDVIGIPKNLTKVIGRDGRLDVLREQGFALKGREVHLLGIWNSALEVTMVERAIADGDILPVRSVDSNIAWAFTRENLAIGMADKPAGTIDMESVVDEALLQSNIVAFNQAAKLDPNTNVTHI